MYRLTGFPSSSSTPSASAGLNSAGHRSERATVSVVVPCFNEAEALPFCIERLGTAADDMRDLDMQFEFILVDDGSSDNTFEIMRAAAVDRRFRFVRLSRNFGH